MDIEPNDAFTASSEFFLAPIPFVTIALDAHDANNLNGQTGDDVDGSNAFIPPAWGPMIGDLSPYIMVCSRLRS